jgi:hypothetical protein
MIGNAIGAADLLLLFELSKRLFANADDDVCRMTCDV